MVKVLKSASRVFKDCNGQIVAGIYKDSDLTPETLDDNALTGGDDNWDLKINKRDGVSGVYRNENGLSGEDAVAQVQRVVDMVRMDYWSESK